MRNKAVQLIQPRHIYAPTFDSGKLGHIYMPTSLLAAAAILLHSEVEVSITDENIEQTEFSNPIIGLSLLGAPYIPEGIKYLNRIKNNFGENYKLLLGGQIVSGLKRKEIELLFSSKTVNGNLYPELAKALNLNESNISRIERISLIPAYEKLNKKHLKLYLSNEIGFYLSQGCKFSCSFCSADRTFVNKEKGISRRASEVYRDIEIAIQDFEYLIKKALEFQIQEIKVYLSNLDLFQSPILLSNFAIGIEELIDRYPQIKISLRGLSTCRSFLRVHEKNPKIIQKLVEIGLSQIGFGIDGATPKIYKETRKPQTVKESLDSIEICKKEYNITPETLMVFGHNDKEDEESLNLALKFCEDMQYKFNALPRPHIAKDIVPGNDGWFNESNISVIKTLLENPRLFQNLDFTATPSPITHPNKEFQELVTRYYIKVCELPHSLTQYVLPELPNMSEFEFQRVKEHNLERYDI